MTKVFFKTAQILVLLSLMFAVGCKKDKKDNTSNAESPDFVTFSHGIIPSSWQTTAWTIDDTVGFDDFYSLQATEEKVAVVTTKTFDIPGYVEFYTTENNFYFYIDGTAEQPVDTLNVGNWRKWVYAVSEGLHTFKWETTTSDKINLDAIKFGNPDLPEVHTLEVVLPENALVATVKYQLSNDGNSPTTHGICWSTTPNPTTGDNKTTNSGNTSTYMGNIEDMIHNTTYYVRAYATNEVGTAYGEELSFKTSNMEVHTTDITQNSQNSITVNYRLSNNGNSLITAHGVCWSTTQNPTIANNKTTNTENVIGNYTSVIEDLDYNTTYYVRAYATNEVGTAYGNQVVFSTPDISTPVEINGVKWATRNVDMPGTFAARPESAGMFYQWNRKIGWSSTNPMINSDGGTTWDKTNPTGTTWEKANDPSPTGYRVPTKEEIQSLTNTTYVTSEWTTENGVAGMRFTDKNNGNSIFLPDAGFRYYNSGLLYMMIGIYWSSTQYDTSDAYRLEFHNGSVNVGDSDDKTYGYSVRPVAE